MPGKLLEQIFDADRALRAAELELLDQEPEQLSSLLSVAVTTAQKLADAEEGALRLERLADLCSQVPGPQMADALISILDDDEPSVRHAAGEALLDVAYDYYAEVARAIDRVLDVGSTGPGMCELPFLLAEVGEPGATKQLKRFLKSESPEVVDALRALANDEREVTIVDFEDETKATVGQLATEAVAALESLEEL